MEKCNSCVKEPTGRINVARFLQRLDAALSRNDLAQAQDCIRFWEKEARSLQDDRGLLSVTNEALGLYRRTADKTAALAAIDQAKELLFSLGMDSQVSGAVIWVNLATTMAAFGQNEQALAYYQKAEDIFLRQGMEGTYEYAALVNNKAAALSKLKQYDQAQQCYEKAISILQAEGQHDGEIGLSMLCLAHVYFDRDEAAYAQVEALLDKAWDYLCSPRQAHDGNYAFILTKCAPSLDYFGRRDEAQALREVAKEIYEGT